MQGRAFSACLLLCVHFAHAAEGPDDALMSEDVYLNDVPKVLTVSRLAQPLADAPAAVTIIDRDTIRASGIVDLPDIFRLVPGFYVGTNAGFLHNTNAVVSYHGMTDAFSRRMQVLIDGRSIYQPLHGGVQWSEVPIVISDIERIEVTRGPNAASYGANSFFGVINIITSHSSGTAGNSINVVRGDGRKEASYRYGGKIDALSYRATVGYREDDGIRNRVDFKRTKFISARADYQASDRDSMEFQFGFTGGDRAEGNLAEDSLVFLPRSKEIYNSFQMVKWRRSLSSDSEFSVQAYHSMDRSYDHVTSSDLSTLLPFIAAPRVFIDNDVRSERYDLEAQHIFSLTPALRAVWGGGVRQDRTTANFYLDSNKTDRFNLQRLFGHLEWRISPALLLNLGAMAEHNDFTGTDISPRISANVTLAAGHTLRLGVSTAVRTPTYLEEKFRTRIVAASVFPGLSYLRQYNFNLGNLDPERIVSREIGYLGNMGAVTLDARLFYDTVRDLIQQSKVESFVPAPGMVTDNTPLGYFNVGESSSHGFETQMQWRIANQTRLIANYAYVKINGKEDRLERYFLESMPSNSVSALLTHRINAEWDGSLGYYYSSATAMLGDGSEVGRAQHWDARVARRFQFGRTAGEVALVAQNLFDQRYEEFVDYNVMRRRAYLNVRVDF